MARERSHPEERKRKRIRYFIRTTTIGAKGLKWSKKQYEKREALKKLSPIHET